MKTTRNAMRLVLMLVPIAAMGAPGVGGCSSDENGGAGGAAGSGAIGGTTGSGGDAGAAGSGGSGLIDASDDAADAGCHFTAPVAIDEVNSAVDDYGPAISADGLALYFTSARSGTSGASDIWIAKRSSAADPFGTPANLMEVNSADGDAVPDLSSDGLTLCFGSDRAGGLGSTDVWCATRVDASSPFGTPVNLTELNSDAWDSAPSPSSDGLSIYFMSDRAGGAGDSDIWYATRASVADPFGVPQNLTAVNSSAAEASPSISADGLKLYFNSNRPGGSGGQDIWMSTRADTSASFGAPVKVAAVNTAANEQGPEISADGQALYLNAGEFSHDIYVSTWACP